MTHTRPVDNPVPRSRGRQRLLALTKFWNTLIGDHGDILEHEDRLSQIEDRLADLGARISEWEPVQEKRHVDG